MSEPSWSNFQSGSAVGKAPPVDNEFDAVCAEVFTSGSGKRLLAALRKKHFDTGGNPMADERALRVRSTQQHFVRELEAACERGLEANKRKPKAV